MWEREEKAEILLGGCVITGYNQNWYCKDCDSKWMGEAGPKVTGHGVVVSAAPSFQEPSLAESDQKILQVAWNVCGLSHAKPPRRVEWKKTMGLRSDCCAIRGDALVLAASLRGKLDPEEWRPLIHASLSLMLHKQLGLKPASIARDLLFVPAVVSVIVGTVWVLVDNRPALVGVLLLIGGMEVLRRLLRRRREDERVDERLWLTVDDIAASEMGRGNMLRALRKVDSLRLPDVELSKRGPLTRPGWVKGPSITERIMNLETSKLRHRTRSDI